MAHERYIKKKRWIFKYTSSFSLCFENDKPILDGYINTCIASDVDFRKFISRYLMTFAGKQIHSN